MYIIYEYIKSYIFSLYYSLNLKHINNEIKTSVGEWIDLTII